MAVYDEVDILMSPSGDLTLDASKDFDMATPRETVQQDVMFRARTEADDFEPHPDVGADLQSLIGEPNSRENAALAEKKLFDSLAKDGRISSRDLRVKAVPISLDNIALYTFVNASNFDVDAFVAAVLSYEDGILNTPGGGQ